MIIGLLNKIRILSQQQDKRAAASYKAALRDAEEFWRLWHSFSDDFPQKREMKEEYLDLMNLPMAE